MKGGLVGSGVVVVGLGGGGGLRVVLKKRITVIVRSGNLFKICSRLRSVRSWSGGPSGCIAPFFDNWLLHSSGISPLTYTDLFRNVYALFSGFEKWNQFSHLFTFLLWLKGTLLFGNFLHDLKQGLNT